MPWNEAAGISLHGRAVWRHRCSVRAIRNIRNDGPGGGRGRGDARPKCVSARQPRHDRMRGNGGAGSIPSDVAGDIMPAVFAGAVSWDTSTADRARNAGRAGTVQDLRSVQTIVIGHAITGVGQTPNINNKDPSMTIPLTGRV